MNDKTKQILTYGAYIGLISILLSVIVYVFDLSFKVMYANAVIGLSFIIINVILLVFFGRKVRSEYHKNGMRYGVAFKNALMMSAISIVFSLLYTLLLYTVIEPDFNERVIASSIEMVERNLYEKGVDEDQIEAIIDTMSEQASKPLSTTLLINVLNLVIMSLIFSSIAALMIKKKENPFADITEAENTNE